MKTLLVFFSAMLFDSKETAMSNEAKKLNKSMSRDNLKEAIDSYLNDGGEIIRLRYADKKTVNKASRMTHHLDRQESSERAKEAINKEKESESKLIFSKVERYRA